MRRLLARAGAEVARLDRRPLAHRLILRAVPLAARLLFDEGAAADLETTFELRVRSPQGKEPVRFAIEVRKGRCRIRRGGAVEAAAVVVARADDLVRMVSGANGWPELLSSGRLELTGNPFLALRFPGLFRLPAATPRPARRPRWARGRQTRRSSRSEATSG